ncbi:MAG: 50S ribosomal protein L29 [Methylacidiphilales bacterium]|nr:50S ribosomal protein L29 [Candidatus Methylacidiphilales bacterium]MDW8348980.1 50S ribosomal protein L29 [Verrucomicrobiae bacterium]
MKLQELRALSDAEIRSKCQEARQELFNLRIQKVTGQLEKPHRIRELKKIIARGKTILRERELKKT